MKRRMDWSNFGTASLSMPPRLAWVERCCYNTRSSLDGSRRDDLHYCAENDVDLRDRAPKSC